MTVYPTPRTRPPTVHDAIAIAAAAHHGQVDKGGRPYVLHPMRVADQFSDEHLQTIAVLHDVVEDTELSLGDLKNFGFEEPILTALDYLTREKGQPYLAYIARVAGNDDAAAVKFADLEDNLSDDRMARLPHAERVRLTRKYEAARARLSKALADRWRAEEVASHA